MACVGSSWLRWGTLLSVMFCLFAQENSWECLDKDTSVTEMSKDVEMPSECVLACTALSYRQVADRQQKLTVRFKDSQPDDLGDFCWFIHRRCSTWDDVFVVLSVNESVPDGESIRLQTNSPTHLNPVQAHDSPSVIPDACGLRFDVTPHLRHLPQHTLCVRLKGIMGNHLECPPFLVIIRKNQ
ncbi:gonadal somatic cell derived factor isoform X1 [Labeo rohita]|uniref:Gonadal somatic cell derived factor isoform X1 n=1 Tax=Labeo rohita TaxID=84645 RepID=A0A498MCH7_LABRO|nr:gonadal somatic cell derived factor isoform X1 [Labeo rohita]RXN18848.1 gonadal somatic cell derived factor isoform X1 [Labeo rohita]